MSTQKEVIAATTIFVYLQLFMRTENKDWFLSIKSSHYAYVEMPLLPDLQYEFHYSFLF